MDQALRNSTGRPLMTQADDEKRVLSSYEVTDRRLSKITAGGVPAVTAKTTN